MSESSNKFRPSGGCLALLVIFGFFCGCAFLVYQLAQPRNLSDVAAYTQLKGGHETSEQSLERPRDLLKVLKNADYLGESVEITESELNRYLHMTLTAKQGGVFNLITRVDGVWVKLHDGYAELIIERRVQGLDEVYAHQTSFYLSASSDPENGSRFTYDGGDMLGGLITKGGKIGDVEVPQSAVKLSEDALKSLASVYEKELELLYKKTAKLEITPDRILYVGRGTGKR